MDEQSADLSFKVIGRLINLPVRDGCSSNGGISFPSAEESTKDMDEVCCSLLYVNLTPSHEWLGKHG
jgi:hypothetical protein